MYILLFKDNGNKIVLYIIGKYSNKDTYCSKWERKRVKLKESKSNTFDISIFYFSYLCAGKNRYEDRMNIYTRRRGVSS